jgi:general secretion pathway protein M
MTRVPAPRRDYLGRALAAAILLALIAAIVGLALRPFALAWADARDSIAASSALLAGFQRAAAERPALEAELKALGGQTELKQPGLIDATNAPLAAARLQSAVKAIVEGEGGQVRSVQELPAARAGGFQRVAIRLDIGVATDGLQKALYRIESAQPYMFVDNLAIRAPEPQRVVGPRAPANDLAIRLEVFGYMRAPAP